MSEFPNCSESCPCRCKTEILYDCACTRGARCTRNCITQDADPGDENDFAPPEDGGPNWVDFERSETVLVADEPWLREVKRHPSSQSFVLRIQDWVDLHDRKQADYGTDVDPFANVRSGAKKLGLPGWIGAVIRMNDKIERLNKAAKQYIETGEINLANEGVLDSFDDLGVYSGIGAVLFEEETDG